MTSKKINFMKSVNQQKIYNIKHHNRKIVILCLTQPKKGYGNLSRCLYLAESLRKNKSKISFIIDYNKSVINELKKRKFDFIIKPNFKRTSTETKFILDYLHNNEFSTIMIDMRERGEIISKFLSKNNCKTILFDDAWCNNVYVDILFNGTNVKSYHNYKKINKNSKLFLNTKYWIVDEKFNQYRKKSSEIKQKKNYHIVVSMGGSDPNNLTTSVVKAISVIKTIKITIIIGPLFSHLSELKSVISGNNRIKLINSTNTIWKDLSRADVVISNGGNTLFELAALSVPTLCIPAFQHEIKYTNAFMSKNFSINLGFKQKNPTKINTSLLKLLEDMPLRKKMCFSGKKIVDGKGLSRVVKIILKFFS